MGLLGAELLGLAVPREDKRLFAVMETDGCGADGVSVATNCWVGRRTMRIADYGKMAATFVDLETGTSFRVRPHAGARAVAESLASGDAGHPQDSGDAADSHGLGDAHQTTGRSGRWEAMLHGYQQMPDSLLLSWSPVKLRFDLKRQISEPGKRVACAGCGEEVRNGREVVSCGRPLCTACAEGGYYDTVEEGV